MLVLIRVLPFRSECLFPEASLVSHSLQIIWPTGLKQTFHKKEQLGNYHLPYLILFNIIFNYRTNAIALFAVKYACHGTYVNTGSTLTVPDVTPQPGCQMLIQQGLCQSAVQGQ